MDLPKWSHKLGKSKRELGIETPKRPRRKVCGCIFIFKDHKWVIDTQCYLHELFNKARKEAKK